jgi:hypothetical protein
MYVYTVIERGEYMTNDSIVQTVNDYQEDKSQHGLEVIITINNKPYEVHRGRQTVVYLKEIGGVPQNYELDEVKDGQLVRLDDDDSVTIKGCEVFKSNLKVGHSS